METANSLLATPIGQQAAGALIAVLISSFFSWWGTRQMRKEVGKLRELSILTIRILDEANLLPHNAEPIKDEAGNYTGGIAWKPTATDQLRTSDSTNLTDTSRDGTAIAFHLEKTASPSGTTTIGQPITYILTASVQHGANAPTTYITDHLPQGVTFVSASGGQRKCVYDAAEHSVQCGPYGLNDQSPGSESVTYRIVVMPEHTGTMTNTAIDSFGNRNTATVEVVAPS